MRFPPKKKYKIKYFSSSSEDEAEVKKHKIKKYKKIKKYEKVEEHKKIKKN